MAGTRELRIQIIGDASSAQRALSGLDNSATKTQGSLKGLATKAVAAFGAFRAATFLKDAAKAAADESKQVQVLANTLRKATGASKKQIESTNEWITKMQNATGIMDDELRPALGKLVISGRSVSQAQKDMGVAADIAAARNLDLATVVQAMSKAALGNVAGLGRLGLATKNAAGETMSYDQILKNAAKTMGGSAAAAANTAAGKAAILQAKFEDLKENIGMALIPVMEQLTNVLMKVTDWFNNLSPGAQKAVLAMGGLLVAVVALTKVVQAFTAAQAAMNIVVSANPYVAAGIAVVALGAAFYFAWQKSETFRKAMVEVGHVLIAIFTGPIGQLYAFIRLLDRAIQKLERLRDRMPDPAKAVTDIPGKVGGAVDRVLPGHGLNPFGGLFDSGGIVPGALGAPKLILAHGGETVLPTHKQSGAVHHHWNIEANGIRDEVALSRRLMWDFSRVS